ncbi:MAG TPA: sulfite exporter TauE/SafE family protein [Actinomycetota bacterium]|nr:sulfite exporter TauE/SafE family protein [Actinomycetota bacterium]
MHFETSGVDVFPLVPVVVGFVIATLTTPAGVSGAFLLLPFQVSVLGFVTPSVTATNLLYNVISTPGGITRYRSQGDLDGRLVRSIVTGAVPGVVVGTILRVTVFADPGDFKAFVGVVLLLLGLNLVIQALRRPTIQPYVVERFSRWRVALLALVAGTVGGIYGVSGGSIIAPVLAGVFGLAVRRVAPAALLATFITSVAGVTSFVVIDAVNGTAARPDWMLALLFGIGGVLGGTVGASVSRRVPERGLRLLLGVLGLTLGAIYILDA